MSTSPRIPAPTVSPLLAGRLRQGVSAVGVLALAAVLGSDDGLVLCPYRRCTGGDCPLCGGTRAAATLMRGDVAASWSRHPLVLLLALQLSVGIAVATIARRRGRELAVLRPALQRVLLTNLALATLIWAVRLTSGAVAGPTHLSLPF